MFDSANAAAIMPGQFVWPDADKLGQRWVEDARKHAPALNSLLTWAFNAGASRIAFQTGHPVWVGVHGRNYRATQQPTDELDFSQIVNHLYGADGMARLQGGTDFDTAYAIQIDRSTRLRFRLNATPTRTSRRDGGNIVLRPIADMPPRDPTRKLAVKSIAYVQTSGWRGPVQLTQRAEALIDGHKEGFKLPWFTSGYGPFTEQTCRDGAYWLAGAPSAPAFDLQLPQPTAVDTVYVYEDPAHT